MRGRADDRHRKRFAAGYQYENQYQPVNCADRGGCCRRASDEPSIAPARVTDFKVKE
jgi:hypothetical protein